MNALIVANPSSQLTVFPEAVRAQLTRHVRLVAPPLTAEELRENLSLLRDVECVFASWHAPVFDRTVLDAAPKLKIVFYAAGTIRYFVTPEFWARGIRVSSAAEANVEMVATFACSEILLSLKSAWFLMREGKAQGRFTAPGGIPGYVNSTVGLISLSRIGTAVAKRLQAHRMRVIAYDPYASDEHARAVGVEKVSLDEVFARSDVVSLHAPLLPETAGMIHGGHFRAMKHGATFINTARGAIVRESEMLDTLVVRPDLTAVLDVTDPEPPVAGSRVFTLPNVIVTPHIAGTIGSECVLMGEYAVAELGRYLAGEPLRGEVNERSLARLA